MPYNYGNYQSSPYFSTSGMGMPNNMQSNMQTAVPMLQVPQAPQPMSNTMVLYLTHGPSGEVATAQVSPGNRLLFMDLDNPVVYAKATDLSGQPLPLEIYDLVKREDQKVSQTPQIDLSEYVKKSDLETMVSTLVNKALEG